MEKSEALRDRILETFASSDVPDADALFDTSDAECLERTDAFRGRKWSDLTFEFLEEQQPDALEYFSATAYRYFLPAYLLAALYRESSVRYFTISTLTQDRRDPVTCAWFLERVGALTPEQRSLLKVFLQYLEANAENKSTRVLCSDALNSYWWNTEKKAFESVEREELRKRIEDAFSMSPYPGDKNLAEDPKDLESKQVARVFQGKKWEEVDLDFLERPGAHLSALFFFSDVAYHYYLPAYLLVSVQEKACDYGTRADVLCALTRRAEPGLRLWFDKRHACLTPAQKKVIREFLLFTEDFSEYESARKDATQALDSYWRNVSL